MHSPDAATEDRELVRLALSGKDAFRRLVEKYQGLVHGTVYRMVRNRSDAEDLTQETFLRAYRALARYDPEVPFARWLVTIAVRLGVDALRRAKRRPAAPLDEVREPAARGHPPDETVALRDLVEAALARLRPRPRAAYVLHYAEGYGLAEVAAMLGTREGTVKSELFRARATLREYLGAGGAA